MAKVIALEALDGVGKTTNALLLASRLKQAGVACMIGQELPRKGFFDANSSIDEVRLAQLESVNKGFGYREKLRDPNISQLERLFIVSAARVWHAEHITKPALAKGEHVIMDRYIGSTYAYQGMEVDIKLIEFCEQNIWDAPPADLNVLLVGKQHLRASDDCMDDFARQYNQEILSLYRAQMTKDPVRWLEVEVDFSSPRTGDKIFNAVYKLIS